MQLLLGPVRYLFDQDRARRRRLINLADRDQSIFTTYLAIGLSLGTNNVANR
jgi:hypothetical protein